MTPDSRDRDRGAARTAGRRAARGFTLVELLVVLALMGLIAGLAAPTFQRSAPGQALRVAAEAVRGELRRARSIALRDNREAAVLFDVGTGHYRREPDGRAQALPDGVALALVTARRERIDETRGRIRFYPDGTSTGGEVRLSGAGGVFSIRIDWFDGGVELHETQG